MGYLRPLSLLIARCSQPFKILARTGSVGHRTAPSVPSRFRQSPRCCCNRLRCPRFESAPGLVAFLSESVSRAHWAKESYIVLDNLPAHKTKAVDEFLTRRRPRCVSTSHRLTRLGSTRSNYGLLRSSKTCWLLASSPPSPTGSQDPQIHPRIRQSRAPLSLVLLRSSPQNYC